MKKMALKVTIARIDYLNNNKGFRGAANPIGAPARQLKMANGSVPVERKGIERVGWDPDSYHYLIKVRKGQRVTSRGIDKNGLVNPLLTREKKEKDNESEQFDTNNERVKYRQALVDIISKDEENTTISHNQINTIRFYFTELQIAGI